MDKKINNIKQLSGKVLLFGGVYSNLQALEALIAVAKREHISPENCICTGDIVGYCGQPEETVQLFKTWKAKSIVGNVEEQLASGSVDCGCDFTQGSRCDNFSKEWYPLAQSKLSKSSIAFIQTLPDYIKFQYANKYVCVVHGSYEYISEFVFKSTNWSLKQTSFDNSESDVIIAGHCGLPFLDEKNNQLWINPGVIGMPANDGLQTVWYAILDDSDGFSVKHYRLAYNHEKAIEIMLANGFPASYAKTLQTGLWDNMEILPEREKGECGKDIL
ncbi:metallophosphoesterase family protein [Kordia antarctica]|nr:metallophosphoesterase family protein [Kordia antarctica]